MKSILKEFMEFCDNGGYNEEEMNNDQIKDFIKTNSDLDYKYTYMDVPALFMHEMEPERVKPFLTRWIKLHKEALIEKYPNKKSDVEETLRHIAKFEANIDEYIKLAPTYVELHFIYQSLSFTKQNLLITPFSNEENPNDMNTITYQLGERYDTYLKTLKKLNHQDGKKLFKDAYATNYNFDDMKHKITSDLTFSLIGTALSFVVGFAASVAFSGALMYAVVAIAAALFLMGAISVYNKRQEFLKVKKSEALLLKAQNPLAPDHDVTLAQRQGFRGMVNGVQSSLSSAIQKKNPLGIFG